MADAGLFVGWGEVVRGREAEALEVFNETLAYFGGLQEEGRSRASSRSSSSRTAAISAASSSSAATPRSSRRCA